MSILVSRFGRFVLPVMILAVGALSLGRSAAAAGAENSVAIMKVDPAVFAHGADEKIDLLVILAEKADLSGATKLRTKEEKGSFVFSRLTATAQRTQASLIAELARRGISSQSFWIVNMIRISATRDEALAIAGRADVASIATNPVIHQSDPMHGRGADAPEAIEGNITHVNAPAVWALGYKGQGIVAAGEDTGYQWDHPALKNHYRGWNGTTADHNYNWHDSIHDSIGNPCGNDAQAPCDDFGHGTHTMGTMIGDDGGTNQIGMAPGAKWIGCRNMDAGAGTPTRYTECFQWMIAPTNLAGNNPDPSKAPDVVNNSWSCPTSEGCTTPDILRTIVEAVRAAGIVPVASAANSGPSCSTVDAPPAIYDAAFTVAATNRTTDDIASFSSRGPVTVDGSNRLKPDISGPGENIRSSIPTNSYGSLSGTSMAGPHVVGAVALLLSVEPSLRGNVDRIEQIIETSAVHLTDSETCGGTQNSSPNNVFGYGRIDVLAAVNFITIFRDGFGTGDTTAWSFVQP